MIISGAKLHIFGNRGMFTLSSLRCDDHDFVSENFVICYEKSLSPPQMNHLQIQILLTLLAFIINVIKVVQSILLMTAEMLITILLQKRLE